MKRMKRRKKNWIEIESYTHTSMQLLSFSFLLSIHLKLSNFSCVFFFSYACRLHDVFRIFESNISREAEGKKNKNLFFFLHLNCSLSSNTIMQYIRFYMNEYTVTPYRISFIIKFSRCVWYVLSPLQMFSFSYKTIFISLTYIMIDHPFWNWGWEVETQDREVKKKNVVKIEQKRNGYGHCFNI